MINFSTVFYKQINVVSGGDFDDLLGHLLNPLGGIAQSIKTKVLRVPQTSTYTNNQFNTYPIAITSYSLRKLAIQKLIYYCISSDHTAG